MADTQKTYTDVEKEIASLILKLGPEEALARLNIAKTKIVINPCYNSFGLNRMALSLLKKETGFDKSLLDDMKDPRLRSDPIFVKFIEKHGDSAGNDDTVFTIVKVPSNVDWHIVSENTEENDGEKVIQDAVYWD